MITIFAKNAEDFTTLGITSLVPSSAEVNENAGGRYDMSMQHPMDEQGKWKLIENFSILRVPVPARETPALTIGTGAGTRTVTRTIYEVYGVSASYNGILNLRTKPYVGEGSHVIDGYENGAEVIYLGETKDGYAHVATFGGVQGWMASPNVRQKRTEQETIVNDNPSTLIPSRQTREQLFRVYKVSRDIASRTVTVEAQHITYDLRGAVVTADSDYSETGETVTNIVNNCLSPVLGSFNIYTAMTDVVKINCKGRNIIDILFNVDDGIVTQTKCRVYRDNFDIFLVPDQERMCGVELRYGKNILSGNLDYDMSGVVTQIIPVGKDKDGNDLYLQRANKTITYADINTFSDLPDKAELAQIAQETISAMPVQYTEQREYDVQVTDDGDFRTATAARNELARLAANDIANGSYAATVSLNVDFVRVELTEQYKRLANAYALNLYDSVPIYDADAGIQLDRVRMIGYSFDAILGVYTNTILGDIGENDEACVYGFQIADGSISGTKVLRGSIGGYALAPGAVNSAQIKANAVKAGQIEAGAITTDKLHANAITAEKIAAEAITANKLDANTVKTQLFTAINAWIREATISGAQIDTASIARAALQTGIITDAYVSSLSGSKINAGTVTADKLVVLGTDGVFYKLNVTAQGITPEQETIQNHLLGSAIMPESITTRQINVTELFANSATIAAIKAGMLVPLSAALGDASQLLKGTYRLAGWTGGAVKNTETGEFSMARTGATADTWIGLRSPTVALGEKWQGRSMTISWDMKSPSWPDVEAGTQGGITVSLHLVNGSTDDTLAKYNVIKQGGKWGVDAVNYVTDAPIVDGVYQRPYVTFTLPDDVDYTDFYVVIYLRRNGNVTFRHVKAEWGEVGTSYATNPMDEEFYAGTKVEITEDTFRVNTDNFEVSNPETDMRFDKSGLAVQYLRVGDGELITGGVVQQYSGAATRNVTSMAQLQALANDELRGRYLPYAVTINVTGTNLTGNVYFRGISGYPLTISGPSASNHAKITGRMVFADCTSRLTLQNFDVAWAGGTSLTEGALWVANCGSVNVIDCCIAANAGVQCPALYAQQGACVSCWRCDFTGWYAALADSGSSISFSGACKGEGTVGSADRTGKCYVDSRSSATMPYPHNSSVWTYTAGAHVFGTPGGGLAHGGGDVPVTTHEYPVVCADSRNVSKPSNSDYYNWANTNTIWQGAWWDSGVTTYYRGVLKFSVGAMSGTVQSVSLTLHRNSGGCTGKANFKVYAMTGNYETGSGKSHGAGRNTSAVLGSGSVGQNSDVTVALNMTVTANSTVYLVIDYDESNVQAGYSESANTAVFARGATLTVNTRG